MFTESTSKLHIGQRIKSMLWNHDIIYYDKAWLGFYKCDFINATRGGGGVLERLSSVENRNNRNKWQMFKACVAWRLEARTIGGVSICYLWGSVVSTGPWSEGLRGRRDKIMNSIDVFAASRIHLTNAGLRLGQRRHLMMLQSIT